MTELFIAEIKILKLLEYKPVMTAGYNSVMHIHSLEVDCSI